MRYLTILSLSLILFACNNSASVSEAELTTDIDSVSYALGVNIGSSLLQQGAGDLDFELMLAAAERAYAGDTAMLMSAQQANVYLSEFFKRKQREATMKTLEEGRAFLEENKQRQGVVTTASGLQYEVLSSGSGISPVMGDSVTFHYTGSFINGEIFETSIGREPAKSKIGGLMRGWNEAVQLRKEGDKWKLYIPSELAYGSMSGGVIPPNSTLIFEVELIAVKK